MVNRPIEEHSSRSSIPYSGIYSHSLLFVEFLFYSTILEL